MIEKFVENENGDNPGRSKISRENGRDRKSIKFWIIESKTIPFNSEIFLILE
jgi:hypothetical protein